TAGPPWLLQRPGDPQGSESSSFVCSSALLLLLVLRSVFVSDILKMLQVSVVLVTRGLEKFIFLPVQIHLNRPRPSIGKHVCHSRTISDTSPADGSEALNDLRIVGHHISNFIQPGLPIHIGRFHN